VAFLGYGLVPLGWMLFPALVVGSLGGIANPAMQSVMSKQAGPSSQGELQGALASIQSVAAIISPLVMTQLFAHFSRHDVSIYLPGAPYVLSAVLTAGCVLFALRATRAEPASAGPAP
jgi:DHA1 family tetracycline resistance protein-like MFS transporter